MGGFPDFTGFDGEDATLTPPPLGNSGPPDLSGFDGGDNAGDNQSDNQQSDQSATDYGGSLGYAGPPAPKASTPAYDEPQLTTGDSTTPLGNPGVPSATDYTDDYTLPKTPPDQEYTPPEYTNRAEKNVPNTGETPEESKASADATDAQGKAGGTPFDTFASDEGNLLQSQGYQDRQQTLQAGYQSSPSFDENNLQQAVGDGGNYVQNIPLPDPSSDADLQAAFRQQYPNSGATAALYNPDGSPNNLAGEYLNRTAQQMQDARQQWLADNPQQLPDILSPLEQKVIDSPFSPYKVSGGVVPTGFINDLGIAALGGGLAAGGATFAGKKAAQDYLIQGAHNDITNTIGALTGFNPGDLAPENSVLAHPGGAIVDALMALKNDPVGATTRLRDYLTSQPNPGEIASDISDQLFNQDPTKTARQTGLQGLISQVDPLVGQSGRIQAAAVLLNTLVADTRAQVQGYHNLDPTRTFQNYLDAGQQAIQQGAPPEQAYSDAFKQTSQGWAEFFWNMNPRNPAYQAVQLPELEKFVADKVLDYGQRGKQAFARYLSEQAGNLPAGSWIGNLSREAAVRLIATPLKSGLQGAIPYASGDPAAARDALDTLGQIVGARLTGSDELTARLSDEFIQKYGNVVPQMPNRAGFRTVVDLIVDGARAMNAQLTTPLTDEALGTAIASRIDGYMNPAGVKGTIGKQIAEGIARTAKELPGVGGMEQQRLAAIRDLNSYMVEGVRAHAGMPATTDPNLAQRILSGFRTSLLVPAAIGLSVRKVFDEALRSSVVGAYGLNPADLDLIQRAAGRMAGGGGFLGTLGKNILDNGAIGRSIAERLPITDRITSPSGKMGPGRQFVDNTVRATTTHAMRNVAQTAIDSGLDAERMSHYLDLGNSLRQTGLPPEELARAAFANGPAEYYQYAQEAARLRGMAASGAGVFPPRSVGPVVDSTRTPAQSLLDRILGRTLGIHAWPRELGNTFAPKTAAEVPAFVDAVQRVAGQKNGASEDFLNAVRQNLHVMQRANPAAAEALAQMDAAGLRPTKAVSLDQLAAKYPAAAGTGQGQPLPTNAPLTSAQITAMKQGRVAEARAITAPDAALLRQTAENSVRSYGANIAIPSGGNDVDAVLDKLGTLQGFPRRFGQSEPSYAREVLAKLDGTWDKVPLDHNGNPVWTNDPFRHLYQGAGGGAVPTPKTPPSTAVPTPKTPPSTAIGHSGTPAPLGGTFSIDAELPKYRLSQEDFDQLPGATTAWQPEMQDNPLARQAGARQSLGNDFDPGAFATPTDHALPGTDVGASLRPFEAPVGADAMGYDTGGLGVAGPPETPAVARSLGNPLTPDALNNAAAIYERFGRERQIANFNRTTDANQLINRAIGELGAHTALGQSVADWGYPFLDFHMNATAINALNYARMPLYPITALAYLNSVAQSPNYLQNTLGQIPVAGNFVGPMTKLSTGASDLAYGLDYKKYIQETLASNNNPVQMAAKIAAHPVIGKQPFLAAPFDWINTPATAALQKFTNPNLDDKGNPTYADTMSAGEAYGGTTGLLRAGVDQLPSNVPDNVRNALRDKVAPALGNPGAVAGNLLRDSALVPLLDKLPGNDLTLKDKNHLAELPYRATELAGNLGWNPADKDRIAFAVADITRTKGQPMGEDGKQLLRELQYRQDLEQGAGTFPVPLSDVSNVQDKTTAVFSPDGTPPGVYGGYKSTLPGEGGKDAGVRERFSDGYGLESPDTAGVQTARNQLFTGDFSTADYARDYLGKVGVNDQTMNGQPSEQRTAKAEIKIGKEVAQNSIDTGTYLNPADRQKLQDYENAKVAYEGKMTTAQDGTQSTVKELLGKSGNYNDTIGKAVAAQDAGDKELANRLFDVANRLKEQSPEVRDYFNALATAGKRDDYTRLQLRRDDALLGNPDVAQQAGFSARNQTPTIAGERLYYDQWSQPQRDAYDAFNDLRNSKDYKARTALEGQVPDKATDPKGYTAWFKENGKELSRLNEVVYQAEKAITDKTGYNPKQIANQYVQAEGKPATYASTAITAPKPFVEYPTSSGGGASGGAKGTSSTSARTSSKSSKPFTPYSRSAGTGSSKGSGGSAAGTQKAGDDFFAAYRDLSPTEKRLVRSDAAVATALTSGTKHTEQQYATALDHLQQTLAKANGKLSAASTSTSSAAADTSRANAYGFHAAPGHFTGTGPGLTPDQLARGVDSLDLSGREKIIGGFAARAQGRPEAFGNSYPSTDTTNGQSSRGGAQGVPLGVSGAPKAKITYTAPYKTKKTK